MGAGEISERRAEIVRRYGPWTNYNIDLGHGVHTIGPAEDRMAEQRVARVLQAVRDAAPKPLSDMRVLDLACYEGAFGIALARHGAEVLAVDAREEHVVKAAFAAEVLGLDRYEARVADVRTIDPAIHGGYDVVLCLGILYHLDAPDCFEFIQRVADVCTGLAVIETQVGLSGRREELWRGQTYHGRTYPENPAQPGAAKDNVESFWPTRASLLNLLGDVGFTSVSEVLVPVIPELIAFSDHVTLMAWAGEQTAPVDRWPERYIRMGHPSQPLRYRVAERVARIRGGGMNAAFPRR
jgi:SAM-dependent methyltransferase